MKRVVIVLLILFWVIKCSCQQEIIKYPAYTSYYNTKTLIPDSVIWMCSPHIKTVGRESGFHATGGRLNLSKDYEKSGYDIGHNADASDMNDNKEDEYNSFDFGNTFPQLKNLNRITWLGLENYTRKLNQPVRVKVSWQGIDGYIGKDDVTVPLYCIKELWYGDYYEKYIMPNRDSVSKHPFTYYNIERKAPCL